MIQSAPLIFTIGVLVGALAIGVIAWGPPLIAKTPFASTAPSISTPQAQAEIDAALAVKYPSLYGDGEGNPTRNWRDAAKKEIQLVALSKGWSPTNAADIELSISTLYKSGRQSSGARLYSESSQWLQDFAQTITGKRKLADGTGGTYDVVFKVDQQSSEHELIITAFEPKWYADA